MPGLGDLGDEFRLGVLSDSWLAVTVAVSISRLLFARVMLKLWNAVLVNAVAAQPYWVNTILS